MDKCVIQKGTGVKPAFLWNDAAEAVFKFRVFRDTGEILDDSADLCAKMDPPGVFQMLLGKKFKVERWDVWLKTMQVGETARFASSDTNDCIQYNAVSKALRDMNAGRKVGGCMGAMVGAHGHSHGDSIEDEIQTLIKNPEELTFEFTLIGVKSPENHEKEVWTMNKDEQKEAHPKFKKDGNDLFKAGDYHMAGENYEKALKCIDLLISAGKDRESLLSEKVKILSNLSECLIRLSRWREAEKRATEALEIDSVNTKAIWRRGRSRVQLMEISGAKSDLEHLLSLEPTMKAKVAAELGKLQNSMAERDNSMKSGLSRMF
ncbi:unnamed protein product [Oikopleura dioica]|uniref:Uncharacterized protein n=1 Tax=Oikopleura dioica TaxID=34765 RepID=E4YRS4_OIKDI|nr:unnamed protein product [Oikopleura dioica]